jgi:hypothetical protein
MTDKLLIKLVFVLQLIVSLPSVPKEFDDIWPLPSPNPMVVVPNGELLGGGNGTYSTRPSSPNRTLRSAPSHNILSLSDPPMIIHEEIDDSYHQEV